MEPDKLIHFFDFIAVSMIIVSAMHLLYYLFMLFLYERVMMRILNKEISDDLNFALRTKYYNSIYWLLVFIFSIRWLAR